MKPILRVLVVVAFCQYASAEEIMDVWPDLAPGESTRSTGEALPTVAGETPRVTRVVNITCPTFTVHLAENPNGAAVVILPGGGFGRIVADKEGTEAARWLNKHGVSAFVLSYRTASEQSDTSVVRPLQDAQRAMALIRSKADTWKLKKDRLGVLGFSAGGQLGARMLCDQGKLAYDPIDDVDRVSHQADFAMLIYPWNIYDPQTDRLIKDVTVSKMCPPTFLVHTDDDASSSLGAVLFYAGLKRHGIPAELHVYGNGGHGYGLRQIKGSQVSSWPDHAAHWLKTRGILQN